MSGSLPASPLAPLRPSPTYTDNHRDMQNMLAEARVVRQMSVLCWLHKPSRTLKQLVLNDVSRRALLGFVDKNKAPGRDSNMGSADLLRSTASPARAADRLIPRLVRRRRPSLRA